MNLRSELTGLANLSTGTARAVFESATAAYRAIFEGEDDELAELSSLGDEIGDDLGGDTGPEGESAGEGTEDPQEGGDNGTGGDDGADGTDVTGEPEAPQEPAPTEEPSTEPGPEQVNEQPQPASVSADALIKELVDLKYPEKIRVVAQQMKQTSRGKVPTADDMVKPVAQAISRYMAKKGYAAMAKDDAIRVVKTIIMAATDVGKKPSNG
jgi:hypothetical protein